jgi:lipoyl(octanoyl) transferase
MISKTMFNKTFNIKHLGTTRYLDTLSRMREFTDSRDELTKDELWLLQHEPVFTQGQAGKDEHLLCPGDIPVVQSDRGGQVTYHGPGQLICYVLIDIKRAHFGVRDLVDGIENSVIGLLESYGIEGCSRKDAPGVYVEDAKISALGLRVRKGRSYHGLSLNVAMDLEPFSRINPCGYEGLRVTDLKTLGINEKISSVSSRLVGQLSQQFGYDSAP